MFYSGHSSALGEFSLQFGADKWANKFFNHHVSYVNDLENLKDNMMAGFKRGFLDKDHKVGSLP